jgi:hypothetical protein
MQQTPTAVRGAEWRGIEPFAQGRGGKRLKPHPQPNCVGPIVPFWPVQRHEWPQRHPRHAQGIGDDGAVHRLAQQQPAMSDRVEDRDRVVTRIDQGDAGGSRCLRPGAPRQALEMQHAADRLGATAGSNRQQHCRIAETARLGQAETPCSPRSPHPVDEPARIECRRRRVAAIAGTGDQLYGGSVVARVEHRADAEEQHRGVVVEEARQQLRPEHGIQFVAEIAHIAAPAIELHAASRLASVRGPARRAGIPPRRPVASGRQADEYCAGAPDRAVPATAPQ